MELCRLCTVIGNLRHDDKLHLGGTAKPSIQETVGCRGDFRNMRGCHDNAATWMMNVFAGSPVLLSLMSTVAALPFFLFTLPAGALADRIDRQKLVCAVNLGMATTAWLWLSLAGCIFSILISS